MKTIKYIIPVTLLSIFSIFFGATAAPAFAEEVKPVYDVSDLSGQPGSYRLEADISLTSTLRLRGGESGYILDLNGHNIVTSTEAYFRIKDDVTIKDSVGTGVILGNNEDYVIQVGGLETSNPDSGENIPYYGNLTIESGTILASPSSLRAILNLVGSTTTINGGAVWSLWDDESVVAIRNNEGATLIINGGDINAAYTALYNFGDIIMNGGKVLSQKERTVVAMENSSFVMNGGTIETRGDVQAVSLARPGAVFTMNDGEILATIPIGESSRGGTGIVAYRDTEFSMHGGRIESTSVAIMSNGSISGSSSGANAKFTITDGTVISDIMAIYAPQPNGLTTISGGTLIGGESAVEIRAGTLNISGGTLIGGDHYSAVNNSSGTTTTGAAVAISQHNTRLPISVNICGGTFRAAVPFSEVNTQGNEQEYVDLIEGHIDSSCGETKFESTSDKTIVSEDIENFIIGGIFTHDVAEFVGDGYGSAELIDGNYIVDPIRRAKLVFFKNGNASLSADKTLIGDTVTVSATPNEGYELADIVVSDSDGDPVQGNGDSYIAPNDDTFVWVVFRAASAPEPTPTPTPTPDPEPTPTPTPTPDPEPTPDPDPEPEPTPAPKPDDKKPVEPDQSSDTPRTNDNLSEYVVLFAICSIILVVLGVYRHYAKKVSL